MEWAGFSIFFLSRQKENVGKRKRRLGGFRISPRTPLKRPGKPLWFSWTFPAPRTSLVEPAICAARGAKRDGTQAVPYAKREFLREISNIFVGDGLCAVPLVRTRANPYKPPSFMGSRFARTIKTQLPPTPVPIVARRVVRRRKANP